MKGSAKSLQRSRNRARDGEPRPRYLVVLRQNVNEPWVQQAIARGDQVVVMSVPWYLRLWWRIKNLFGRNNGKDRKELEAAGTSDSSGVPGVRSDRDADGQDGEDDLY